MPSRPGVLIVVENLAVPGDRRVWQEARALTEAGYAVSVICPKSRGFEHSYVRIEEIEIYRFPSWEASGAAGYLLEYSWALASQFWLAIKVFRKTGFQVLHGCNPPDTVFLLGLVFKMFGVRFIFDQHDPAPELCKNKFKRETTFFRMSLWAEYLSFRAADATIVTNDTAKEVALTRGHVSPDRLFVVRGCPDLKDFQLLAPSQELKEGRKNLVVYLGLMGTQDGVDLLVDSIEYLVKTKARNDVLFVLIGYGPELSRLRAMVVHRGLEQSVRFTGPLYGEKLRAYLATADVAVSPDPSNGLNDRLTMVKIFEYMACGLPTVLFDLKEGRISAAGAALYAKPNDTTDFGEQVALLLDCEDLRAKLGAIGRKRAHTELNWDWQKRILLNAYDMVGSYSPQRSSIVPERPTEEYIPQRGAARSASKALK
jgi:glycosyltransferase involved in cell wall biosynthesis